MAEWFAQNGGTLLVALILAFVVFLAVRGMIRDRKKGKGACSCGCGGCPMAGACRRKTGENRP